MDARVAQLEQELLALRRLVESLQGADAAEDSLAARALSEISPPLNNLTAPEIDDHTYNRLQWAWTILFSSVPVAWLLLLGLFLWHGRWCHAKESPPEMKGASSTKGVPEAAQDGDEPATTNAGFNSGDGSDEVDDEGDAKESAPAINGTISAKAVPDAAQDGNEPATSNASNQREDDEGNVDGWLGTGFVLAMGYSCAALTCAWGLLVPWVARWMHDATSDQRDVQQQFVPWRVNFYVGAYTPFVSLGLFALIWVLGKAREKCCISPDEQHEKDDDAPPDAPDWSIRAWRECAALRLERGMPTLAWTALAPHQPIRSAHPLPLDLPRRASQLPAGRQGARVHHVLGHPAARVRVHADRRARVRHLRGHHRPRAALLPKRLARSEADASDEAGDGDRW